ncbi:Ni/Fe-hydrogenase, b-type cytochrome subunit [Mobiluncus mulieris]|uniref:Ni/Fe-hydrogenase, b-type cytochrome subunit n=2 Tax=Mobiluncus mulieris TaxID=2052 RepID=E0QMS9_9ACTO|nr:Ni/Fe-hydrogenase, b-type cytochrome subunit [Mobiluncus mulieris]EEZ92345.1 Ni/Fe-hydrogenase, b-type cytochrome subunit [Mobiluncus mulieris 28-1]EFM47096.1 Ni/Fe-hydrogenase, b-type cytochrome subunit [Mobiluncus mulieris ATCC 35239]EFN93577.1 Ni/Fe-hydrogenase, b-type cytochrome subunit [Mobiluncus mulieris FB024-16]MCU9968933.1 Ni/Fe-hydrogenase, b-type cytochrome subunit [Mobiluncus mulieris]MCU9971163.1 Ni/Fe-hydrogenase, b-type cytochrome subunit [Mobiluncus mulieris]
MRLDESTNRNSNYVPQRQVEFFSSGEQSREKRKPGVEVGGGLSVGGLSLRRLLTMAAVSPADSTDPVDVALRNSLRFLFRHGAPETGVSREDFDPAKDRRYSLARVHGFQRTKDSPAEKTVIIRGDLESVMNVAKPSHQDRILLRKNAQMAGSRGYRCLAVASATVGDNGELGAFRMEGFVNVRPVGTGLQDEDLTPTSDDWVRLQLWSAGLRFLHWLNVVLIVLLSVTGYYIMDPFFGDTFFRGIETGFLMGWMRFIHFSCGFIWIAVGLARAFIAFFSKDRYMRWETFWPIHSKEDMKNLGRTLGFYTFLRKEGPLYVAHNPLQQLTYTSIYIVGALQMLIGLSLYALYHMSNPVWAFIALPCSWFGIPIMRLLHVMIMFLFWWFVIAHIYLAFRADSLERHGGVSAMISGGVWMRRTSRPVDAPEL